MMKRLTSGMRWRAAWLLSLIYLLAVFAPAVANAFAVSPNALSHHSGMRAMAAHHQQMSVYTDTHAEAVAHHHHGQAHEHDQHAPAKGDAQDLQCCGLACLSALPASLLSVLVPDLPMGVQLAANASDVASRAPPRLYRPPIS